MNGCLSVGGDGTLLGMFVAAASHVNLPRQSSSGCAFTIPAQQRADSLRGGVGTRRTPSRDAAV